MADLRLRVNGRDYGGWERIRVTRGIEAVSGSFELEVADRWAEQREPWPIAEEDECVVLVEGVPLVTGYVDSREATLGPDEHSLTISGRDKTGALVDCSAVLKRWEFVNERVLTLAKVLAEPFGIKADLQRGPGLLDASGLARVPKLTVDPGETAFEALERACRLAGVLPISDGKGGLLLARAGTTRAKTALVEGKNIKRGTASGDATGRFSSYRVLGQTQGTDWVSGAAAAAIKASASDAGVRRKERVLVIRPDANLTPAQAQLRAEWEATVRAARAVSVTITVQGWHQGDGALWPVNALVAVDSPGLGIKGDMLITEATYSLDDSGTTTRLSLKRPDAFTPEPVVPPAGAWAELRGGVPR